MVAMTAETMLVNLRAAAAAKGVTTWRAGDGRDGDALAGLFPGVWWAVIATPHEMAGKHGPYGTEEKALRAGLELVI